jgi:hypothetical protein
VKRQEDIRARNGKTSMTPEEKSNPHDEKVAKELGPYLRIENGHGPMALWSGGDDVSKYAQMKGYSTLESTPAGRVIAGLELYKDPKAVTPLWNHLSEEFVRQNPKGSAHVFMRTHDPMSVLYRQEIGTIGKLSPDRATVWHPLVGDKLQELQAVKPNKTLGSDSTYDTDDSTFAIFRPGKSRSSCGLQLRRYSTRLPKGPCAAPPDESAHARRRSPAVARGHGRAPRWPTSALRVAPEWERGILPQGDILPRASGKSAPPGHQSSRAPRHRAPGAHPHPLSGHSSRSTGLSSSPPPG